MRKKHIYMYPMWESTFLQDKHPYVYHLSQALLNHFDIVNYGTERKGGVLDIARYIHKTEILYLNWIENIKFIQAVNFLILFLVCKVLGTKIVWTHHNLTPHRGSSALSKFLIGFLSKNSDIIVIHTKESLPTLGYELASERIFSFFHPMFGPFRKQPSQRDILYDFLIWGNVRKSKGVHSFLAYLKEKGQLQKYKIKIIGKFESEAFYKQISENYKSDSIDIENKFVDAEHLDLLHSQAKFVFFPYTGKSVLNSGALVTSLPKGIRIIGPSTGAFKELGEQKLILLYNDFQDVLDYISPDLNDTYPASAVCCFSEEHTWEKFAEMFEAKISGRSVGEDNTVANTAGALQK